MTSTFLFGMALAALGIAGCSPTAIDERAPCGTGSMTTLVANQSFPRYLALSGGDLYWTNYVGGELMAVPKAGGKPRVVASGLQHPEELAVDAVNAYVVVGKEDNDDNQILAINKASGALTVLVEPPQLIHGLREDRDRVYWGSDVIKSQSKQGGSPLALSSDLEAYPLAVDDEHVYAYAKHSGWVLAVPKLEGSPVLVTWIATSGFGRGFDAYEDRFYFASGSGIFSFTKSGNVPIHIASEELGAQAIAAGGSCVYWSALDDSNTGHVRAASALGDGDVVTVAEGIQLGASMVADESGVYWVDPPTGTILSLSR